jgi:hypothetical protein
MRTRKLSGSTGDARLDEEARVYLVWTSLDLIRACYREAIRLDIDRPVVILCNLLDENGYRMAVGFDGEAAVEDHLSACEGGIEANKTPTMAFPVPSTEVPERFKGKFLGKARPSNAIPFICASSGGSAHGYIPIAD